MIRHARELPVAGAPSTHSREPEARALGAVHLAPAFTRSLRGRVETEHTVMCLIFLVNHGFALRAYHNPGIGGGARSPSVRPLSAVAIT